jgi:hypothetical protein
VLLQSAAKDEDQYAYKDILKRITPDNPSGLNLIDVNLSELEEREETKFQIPEKI